MRALVVYESFFGCTRAVAEAVAAGLIAGGVPTVTVDVRDAPPLRPDVDLIVVGAPTHFWTVSSRASRWLQAQYWGSPTGRRRRRRPYGRPIDDVALRHWMRQLRPGPRMLAAGFDTRSGRLSGSAARAITHRLRRAGALLTEPPQSFLVTGIAGPLSAGELERAAAWGSLLAEKAREPRR